MNDNLAAAKLQIQAKSMGLGIVLTLLFGGFGIFYVSLFGGIICSLIEVTLLLLSILTFGLGIFIVIPFHILLLIYTVVAINNHNKNLLKNLAN